MNKMISYLQLLWLLKSPPALFSRLFGLPWYRNTLEQWVAPILTPNAVVLEVGCAGGDFARSLAERGMNVCAVDRSSQMIAKAEQITSQVKFDQADATKLPFPDQHFDAVLAASLINVVDSPVAVLNEMLRVCRKEGTVSVLVPTQTFSDADAKRYVDVEKLTGFSSAAFRTWHRLGRKMDIEELIRHYKNCGFKNITTNNLLGGMIVSITGLVETESLEK